MKKQYQPVAILEKIKNGQLIVRCPYCDQLHIHGIGLNKETDACFGMRVPHCNDQQLKKAGITQTELMNFPDYKIKRVVMLHEFV